MEKAVLYVGNYIFPNGNASGKRVYGNACILRDLGYKVFSIGFHKGTEMPDSAKEYNQITYSSIPYVDGIKRLNVHNPYKVIMNQIQSILGDGYDLKAIIMYGSLATSKLNMMLIRWGRKHKVAVYYDHVDIFPTPQKKPIARYLMKLYENSQLDKRVFPSCDGIICISSYLSKIHEPYSKTVVIPPVVETHCRAIETNDSECIRIVYAGTISDKNRPVSEWKDRIDLMVDAAYQLMEDGYSNIHFNFIGFNEEDFIGNLPIELKGEYRNKIKDLTGYISFKGFMASADTMNEIRKSDFSILIRDKKITTMAGFPTKVSESITCGVPVITNDTSDIATYIVNGENGFVVDTSDMVGQLKRVCRMTKDEIHTMKENCYKTKVFIYSEYLVDVEAFLKEETK